MFSNYSVGNGELEGMRTGELTEMVLNYYSAKEDGSAKYIGITQVRAATGWEDLSTADVLVMGNWPSAGSKLWGFEVKTSRADWLNEVKAPNKCTPTKKYCNKWWLVIAEQSFVKDGELPEDWGMMAVINGKLKIVKEAPELIPESLTHVFVASMLRSNNKETIALDVHKDKLKDAVRDAEAAMKTKYGELLDYVKFLHKGLGIKLDYKESYSYGERAKKWVASLSAFRTHTPEELLALLKSALNNDLEDIGYRLYSAKKDAQKVLEITDKALKDTKSDWSNR